MTTSTVLIDGHGGALLVDPAYEADELADFAPALLAHNVRAVAGLATHVHYDHVLWHPGLGAPPRWASPWTANAVLGAARAAVVAPLQGTLPEDLIELAARLVALPSGPVGAAAGAAAGVVYEVPWSGPLIRCYEHQAHAPGHLAVELPSSRVLLAGDMLSDVELPMPDDDDQDLTTYLTGLDVLAPVVARAGLLVPGHGTPTEHPMARVDADRRYLDDLIAGRQPEDQRIGLPGMAELHAQNLVRAARTC